MGPDRRWPGHNASGCRPPAPAPSPQSWPRAIPLPPGPRSPHSRGSVSAPHGPRTRMRATLPVSHVRHHGRHPTPFRVTGASDGPAGPGARPGGGAAGAAGGGGGDGEGGGRGGMARGGRPGTPPPGPPLLRRVWPLGPTALPPLRAPPPSRLTVPGPGALAPFFGLLPWLIHMRVFAGQCCDVRVLHPSSIAATLCLIC